MTQGSIGGGARDCHPLLPQQLPADYLDFVRQPFVKSGGSQAALIGIPLGNLEAGYTNTVEGWMPGQTQPYQYDKHHLVPFGEFIPPMFRWFTDLMNIPLGTSTVVRWARLP